MSTKKPKKLLKKKRHRDEEDALIQPKEEPKEETNEAFQDDFPTPKKSYVKKNLLKSNLKGNDFAKKIKSLHKFPDLKQKYSISDNIKRAFMKKYLTSALNKALKKWIKLIFRKISEIQKK